MNSIKANDKELRTGQLMPDRLEMAVNMIRNDGYLVLEGVIDRSHLETLNAKMLADLPAFIARADAPYNFNRGNIQHDPPPFSPYLFQDILMNDLVIDVTSQVLGKGVKNGYYSGNTALAGSEYRQPPHADVGQLWPNLEQATPAFGLVVNVPLVDMSAENGSTEIWPGTHLDTSIATQHSDIKVDAETLESRRRASPPLQPCVTRGSVMIRDIRMWHAGMPNHTGTPRVMIAMIHWVHLWSDNDIPSFLVADRDFFDHPILSTRAKFVEGPIDYIHKSESYDYRDDAEN